MELGEIAFFLSLFSVPMCLVLAVLLEQAKKKIRAQATQQAFLQQQIDDLYRSRPQPPRPREPFKMAG